MFHHIGHRSRITRVIEFYRIFRHIDRYCLLPIRIHRLPPFSQKDIYIIVFTKLQLPIQIIHIPTRIGVPAGIDLCRIHIPNQHRLLTFITETIKIRHNATTYIPQIHIPHPLEQTLPLRLGHCITIIWLPLHGSTVIVILQNKTSIYHNRVLQLWLPGLTSDQHY